MVVVIFWINKYYYYTYFIFNPSPHDEACTKFCYVIFVYITTKCYIEIDPEQMVVIIIQ